MSNYARPDVLVETNWVKEHLHHPRVKLVEVDLDTKAYEAGHIPGAVAFNWQTQLQDQVRRDIPSPEAFARLLGNSGISPEDTVILYGDHNNWFAAHGFWLFKIYGHKDVRLMNGGRVKWLSESDKPLTTQVPEIGPVAYRIGEIRMEFRAMAPEILSASQCGAYNLIDVRSPDEFTGRLIAPIGMTETAQRGGHVPGATNIPWNKAVQSDGTFKSDEELRAIYLNEKKLDPKKPSITYCRIGERCSHSWFVIRYLLGFDQVKNYDGSWTEYGNLVGVPIEK